MKNKIFLIFLLSIFLQGCGFKVINHSELSKFDISNISTSGDKRINFIIKNNLIFGSNKNEKTLIDINLKSEKQKTVKEKNIKNEITKYQINIIVECDVEVVRDKKNYKILKSKTGNYDVATQYSQTIDNEKKLVSLLSKEVAEEILYEIRDKLNDL